MKYYIYDWYSVHNKKCCHVKSPTILCTSHTHTHVNMVSRLSLCYDLLSLCLLVSIAILSGKKPPAYLVYTTGRGTYPSAGGLADRLKGITTVFFLAVLLGTITITLTVLLCTITITVYYYIVVMI